MGGKKVTTMKKYIEGIKTNQARTVLVTGHQGKRKEKHRDNKS